MRQKQIKCISNLENKIEKETFNRENQQQLRQSEKPVNQSRPHYQNLIILSSLNVAKARTNQKAKLKSMVLIDVVKKTCSISFGKPRSKNVALSHRSHGSKSTSIQ